MKDNPATLNIERSSLASVKTPGLVTMLDGGVGCVYWYFSGLKSWLEVSIKLRRLYCLGKFKAPGQKVLLRVLIANI